MDAQIHNWVGSCGSGDHWELDAVAHVHPSAATTAPDDRHCHQGASPPGGGRRHGGRASARADVPAGAGCGTWHAVCVLAAGAAVLLDEEHVAAALDRLCGCGWAHPAYCGYAAVRSHDAHFPYTGTV